MKERKIRKSGDYSNPLLKNLRGRWRPQYSDWPVLAVFRQQVSRHDGIASLSIVMTACSFEKVFQKIETTIFSMLDLENLPQKKLGLRPKVSNTFASLPLPVTVIYVGFKALKT